MKHGEDEVVVVSCEDGADDADDTGAGTSRSGGAAPQREHALIAVIDAESRRARFTLAASRVRPRLASHRSGPGARAGINSPGRCGWS